jgi:hypothetical protein
MIVGIVRRREALVRLTNRGWRGRRKEIEQVGHQVEDSKDEFAHAQSVRDL